MTLLEHVNDERRRWRELLVSAILLFLAIGSTQACGGDDGQQATGTPDASTITGTRESAGTRTTTSTSAANSNVTELIDVRVAGHPEEASPYDRITWEFSGAIPSAPVIAQLDTPPDGQAGSSWLLVRFGDDAGDAACGSLAPVVGGATSVIVDVTCGLSGREWVIGLSLDAAPLAIPKALDAPARWFIDVLHPSQLADTSGPDMLLMVWPSPIHAHHPRAGAFCANNAQGPDTAEVSAGVYDASGVSSVEAIYFVQTGPDSSGQQVQPMNEAEGLFYKLVVGPFVLWNAIDPRVVITVRSRDTLGNESSQSISLDLIPCET